MTQDEYVQSLKNWQENPNKASYLLQMMNIGKKSENTRIANFIRNLGYKVELQDKGIFCFMKVSLP